VSAFVERVVVDESGIRALPSSATLDRARLGGKAWPDEGNPKYPVWTAALKREFAGLDDGAILIGHSIGGTILMRTVADDPPKLTVGGLFLIAAPFVGNGGWHSEDIEPLSDVGAKLPEQIPIYLYHGSGDTTAPVGHLDLYAKAIPQAVVRCLSDRDHQLNNDMSKVAADISRLGKRTVLDRQASGRSRSDR
jgi:hypothetical protein